jgi:hypothetical protein
VNFQIEVLSNEEINKYKANEQFKDLAKAWHFRQERIAVGLRFQILLKEKGSELLKLIEPKYQQEH